MVTADFLHVAPGPVLDHPLFPIQGHPHDLPEEDLLVLLPLVIRKIMVRIIIVITIVIITVILVVIIIASNRLYLTMWGTDINPKHTIVLAIRPPDC